MKTNRLISCMSAGVLLMVLLGACKKIQEVDPTGVDLTESHETDDDYVLDTSTVRTIQLNGSSIAVTGEGASVSGSTVTITRAGIYSVSGSLSNGQIVVNSADAATVKLLFNGITVHNSKSAPVFIRQAEKVVVYLEPNTVNTLTDAATYTFEGTDDEPNATLFSKTDMTIFGTGTLVVDAKYNDAVASKDGLIITEGNFRITSADDGFRGKDYLVIKSGTFSVQAVGDAFKSDNETDASRGYIVVEDGTYDIVAGADGFQAETQLQIRKGNFSITTGGGSGRTTSDSAKGLKAGVKIDIQGGVFNINSADDAIHSNNIVTIEDGTFTLATADDAIHADATLTINGGDIVITKSYEGIESASVTINGGNIDLVSSDDGINAAGESSGTGNGGRPGGTASGNYLLTVKGGFIAVNAGGDGIDSNGNIEMTGGTLVVHGPTSNGNGSLDYDGSFKISGGLLVAAGSSGMLQAPGTSSTQNSVLAGLGGTQQAGSLIHISKADGTSLLTFKPVKNYQAIAFSSPNLSTGGSYEIYLGGSASGTVKNGLYTDGTYTGGNRYGSFTVSSVVTSMNVSAR